MGVDLPLRRVFATPRLSALAEHIDALEALNQKDRAAPKTSESREEMSF